MTSLARFAALAALVAAPLSPALAAETDQRIVLDPSMLTNESTAGEPQAMVDEQGFDGAYDAFTPATGWTVPSQVMKQGPVHAYLDLGEEKDLSRILFYDTNGKGDLQVSIGTPGNWTLLLTEPLDAYKRWKSHDATGTRTRYVRLSRLTGAGVNEILLFEESADAKQARLERDAMREKALQEVANRPRVDAGPVFGELPLIQEIVAGAETPEGVEFVEAPAGVSRVETILGQPTRVLPPEGDAKYFAYRLGTMKMLEPGKAYLLTVEFPEDAARSFSIENRGGELIRGIQTGHALGDVIFTYTNNNLESIDVPLSGKMETFQQLFYLSDRFADLKAERGPKEPRPSQPEDGFYVVVSLPEGKNIPETKGAAVHRIRLFEVPEPEKFNVQLNLPPEGLPQRHIFVREEMGDTVINPKDAAAGVGALADPVNHWVYKAKVHNFLGMNTFTKDLLEFGSTQHWASPSNSWSFVSAGADVWGKLLPILQEHHLNVLPYYEYAGSKGSKGLGFEKRAKPLSGGDAYTHITWSEKATADVTDPETIKDFQKFIDETILKFKDQADFVGAWLRPRVSSLPIGFADATLQRFAQEANNGVAVSRAELKEDDSLRDRYYSWWFEKRKEFLLAIRDYLRQNGIDDGVVVYTAYAGEPGPGVRKPGPGKKMALVTDQPDLWKGLLDGKEDYEPVGVMAYDEYVGRNGYEKDVADWRGTWGSWEWQHADPKPDPENYQNAEGVVMTMPFNRLYTVSRPEPFDLFRTESGVAAVRHYPLNENTRHSDLGYYCGAYDRSGPYTMLAEARAVAYGDVRFLGYLEAYNYTRGFPEYVRRFNANFLALPALPSEALTNASSEPEVVVRRIDAGEHGAYYAVVNTGLKEHTVKVTLADAGRVLDASTGQDFAQQGKTLQLTLYPAQLQSLRVVK